MDEPGEQYEIFVELRKRLGSGLLILRKDVAQSPADVKVWSKDSSLHVETNHGSRCAELPPGVTVVPDSCQQVSTGANGEGLHFRLQLRVDQPAGNTEDVRGSVIECLQVQQNYRFRCQACGSCVLDQRQFRRVLPLPSGNWSELVGEWCCHPDPFANRKLVPRPGDCLTGDTFFLLEKDEITNRTLHVESNPTPDDTTANHSVDSEKLKAAQHNPQVTCKHCSSTLGEAPPGEVLKLFITEVITETDSGNVGANGSLKRCEYLEKTLSSRLVELSSAQSIFRFSLQAPDSKAVILLWLLNADTLVASFPVKPVSGDSTLISPGNSHYADEHQSSRALSAVKVLYLSCSSSQHQDIIEAWEKDISVHPLTLPASTCQEVLQLLIKSTSCLPPSLRCMNSYQVAYIRR